MHIVRELCAESELAQVFNSQESLVACYSRWGGDRVLSAGGQCFCDDLEHSEGLLMAPLPREEEGMLCTAV